MSDFEPLPPDRLSALSDERLVAYAAAAHAAGDSAAERDALGILAYTWEPIIRARVALKVPAQDCDDVTVEVQESLIRSSFEGKLVGQFGAFLRTITQRRIADYHRVRERHPELAVIDGGGTDDEGGQVSAIAADEAGAIELVAVVERVLATREPMHQKVIRLYGPEVAGFMNLSAAEVKAAIDGDDSDDTVSIANVAQIWRRFRVDLEEELGG